MDEMALQENGDRSDAAAHVDDGCAELLFVFRQNRKPTRKGREERTDHIEMAALDREFQVVERRRLHGHCVHRHAYALAKHA